MDFRITLSGTSPLIMNNARLANPLDPAAKVLKQLTAKRSKTDQDHEDIFRAGHAGALYLDADIGPYLPADNIWKSLYEGALKHRMGPKIKEGVVLITNINPLAYRGPREGDKLWADENFRFMAARVTGAGARRVRVPFCRPIFRSWSTEADGILDPGIIDVQELRQIAETAGSRIGLGDWRPRYGRYTAEIKEI